jgi:hypothetical protein
VQISDQLGDTIMKAGKCWLPRELRGSWGAWIARRVLQFSWVRHRD